MIYEQDMRMFSELLSKFTNIDESKISNYLESHNVADVLLRPTDLTQSVSEIAAIEDLRKLRNIFDNLKKYDLGYTITSPQSAADFFADRNKDIQDKEYFSVAFLNSKNQILDISVTEGTINSAYVYLREIFKEALLKNANCVILCHNHPSGNPAPSLEDKMLTERFYKAGEVMGVSLIDHVILGNQSHISLKEKLGSTFGVYENSANYNVKEKTETYSLKERMELAKDKSKGMTSKINPENVKSKNNDIEV